MFSTRRKLLSQNFLHNRKLASSLVRLSSFGKNDLVLEIGPGKGILTEPLIQLARQIIAVEIDPEWCTFLCQKFAAAENFTLHEADFLNFTLPKNPYKVFANIPFAIEGQIIRKLIDDENPPQDCYLVVNEKLAERLSAKQQENMFSVQHKPWFEFSIVHRFRPTDFSPVPNVNAVLFRFKLKPIPLLPINERKNYQQFIQLAFTNGQPIRNNLKKKFTTQKVDRVLQELSISKQAKPTHLSLEQWILLYKKLAY